MNLKSLETFGGQSVVIAADCHLINDGAELAINTLLIFETAEDYQLLQDGQHTFRVNIEGLERDCVHHDVILEIHTDE
jgi:hypothetical protein